MKRGQRAGNRFDVFMNVAAGNDTRAIPSNEEIRRRNLAEHAADLAAEEKTNADAAALAARNAEEERLGISGMMQKAREHDARENEVLRKRWAHSYESIAKFVAFDENDPAGNVLAHSYYDKFHTLPHVTEPVEISGEEAQKAALNFFEWLEHEGVVLDDDSKSKIMLYVGLVAYVDKRVDPRLSSCWNAAYARLANELQVLNVTRKPKPQNPKEPDFDTLLATRSTDDPILRNAAQDFAIREAQPTFQAWTESLMNSFGYAMSLPIAKQVSDWFIRMNRSFLDRRAYDDCRKSFVREGLFPRTCLTADDLAAEELDGLNLNTAEGRRRAAQLHREGLRRAESQNQSQF